MKTEFETQLAQFAKKHAPLRHVDAAKVLSDEQRNGIITKHVLFVVMLAFICVWMALMKRVALAALTDDISPSLVFSSFCCAIAAGCLVVAFRRVSCGSADYLTLSPKASAKLLVLCKQNDAICAVVNGWLAESRTPTDFHVKELERIASRKKREAPDDTEVNLVAIRELVNRNQVERSSK